MDDSQNKFWINLSNTLKRDANLKDVDPEEFFIFVEALIEKYFILA